MKLKKIFPIAIIIISIGVVGYIAFGTQDINRAWKVLISLNPLWLAAALISCFGYVFFDGMTYYTFLKKQGYKIKLTTALYLAFVGFYYCDITPGASGGQPMQVYEMSKRGVPMGIGTSAVIVKFLMNQTATTVIALVLIILNNAFIHSQLGSVMTFVYIGLALNAVSVPAVILAVIKPKWIKAIINWCVNLGVRFKWVKNKERVLKKADRVIDEYREGLLWLIKRPKQIILQFLIAVACMLGLFFVTYFVYRAFGYYGVSWMKLLATSTMLYISASYIPLPGASGAQESGFLLYFKNIFSGDAIGVALLIWRFITFYLFLICGAVMTTINQVRNFIAGRKNKDAEEAGDTENDDKEIEELVSEAEEKTEEFDNETEEKTEEQGKEIKNSTEATKQETEEKAVGLKAETEEAESQA